tara:strand:+ start:216 stop:356 length:141 start_codon:yes stop_codon:yes gene_type:complete
MPKKSNQDPKAPVKTTKRKDKKSQDPKPLSSEPPPYEQQIKSIDPK